MTGDDLNHKIKVTDGMVRGLINTIRSRLDSLEHAMENERILNSLGELQALGPQLDASVAVLATLQEVKRGQSR